MITKNTKIFYYQYIHIIKTKQHINFSLYTKEKHGESPIGNEPLVAKYTRVTQHINDHVILDVFFCYFDAQWAKVDIVTI